ncbi:hypothetical protein CBS147326_2720 [Penicillium roqueforti]|nr:hypothetical protein CBS147326_2720 [Penicillium roqueforti]
MAQAPPAFTPDGDFAELETPQGTNNGGLSVTALARFEFEAGKANDGTKILMIEWEDDDLTRSSSEGFWNVSWTGKTTVLPADERPSDSLHRFYLLLPPNATIPPVVTLSYELQGTPDEIAAFAEKRPPQSRDSFKLNPLPAIFPPGLGATGRAAGKKGVLHTIWAKKRLRVLEQEIATESQKNIEGIALQMAIQEKEWIEENFGVGSRAVDSVSGHDSLNSSSMYPVTPVSPVNSKKLGDKLKGLKLQTSEKDLAVNNDSAPNTAHLLSPRSPDVAISSFSSFSDVAHRHLHSMPTPDTNSAPTLDSHANPSAPELLRPVAFFPPSAVQEAQQNSSLTGFAAMGTVSYTPSDDSGDGLFAKALSPRSPDLPRSPFSFR